MFDWKEREKAEKWTRARLREKKHVYDVGAGTDSYILHASKKKLTRKDLQKREELPFTPRAREIKKVEQLM